MELDPAAALDALRTGGKAAVARALTTLDRAPESPEILAALEAAWRAQRGVAVGLTGPPGVGKSTLIGALIDRLRASGRTVAVLAVDPSSRRSGGALLGDRTRFGGRAGDSGLFVRSVAARDRLGGLAETVWPAIVLLRAVFDIVLIETVGVGQSETEIVETADRVVLCAQPGAGDALQVMKAGVVETPDLVVVTKADLGAAAERAAADLRSGLALATGRAPPPVMLVSAERGDGLDGLAEALAAPIDHAAARQAAQARAWAHRNLREAYGREGEALWRDDPSLVGLGESPFQIVNVIRARLSAMIRAASGAR